MDDQTIETTETEEETEELNFGVEVAKTFALSTAMTAGTVVAFVAIGYAWSKLDAHRKARALKKARNAVENAEKE